MNITLEETYINDLKEGTFANYFEKKVKNNPYNNQGKTFEVYTKVDNVNLSYHITELSNKYSFLKSREEIEDEYIYQAYIALIKFVPEGDEKQGWENIQNGTDKLLINQLNKYIRINTEHAIWQFVNPDAKKTSKTNQDGEKIQYILKTQMEALDYLLQDDGINNPPIQISDENQLFDETIYSFHMTYFQKWFDEKKEDFLHPSQLKFMEDLKTLSNDTYLTPEEFEEKTGVKWVNNSKRMRRIEEAVIKAWEKHQPEKKSRRQLDLEPKVKYLQGYLDLMDKLSTEDSDLKTQNIRLTDYLVKGMKDKKTEYEMFQISNKILELDELVLFNRIVKNNNEKRVSLRASLLVKMGISMEEMLESFLEQIEGTVKEVDAITYYDEVDSNITKEEKEKTTITTYDLDGNLKGKNIKLIKNPLSSGNVYYMLPTGAMTRNKP